MLPDFLVVVPGEPAEGPTHGGIGAAAVALGAGLGRTVARRKPFHVGGAELGATLRTFEGYHSSVHTLWFWGSSIVWQN